MSYYQNREALVQIAGALVDNGWTIFGYKADESDSMTDYFSPASFSGIASKNGYVLVIDNNNTRLSGYEVKEYNYNKTSYKATARIEKLEAMMNDSASTENEKASCAALIEKEKEKQGIAPTYTVTEVYPTFAHGNPKACNWHVEFNNQIIAKGKGAFAVNSYDWEDKTKTAEEQKAEKLSAFINRIEAAIKQDSALESEVVKVPKTVIKPVEKDVKSITANDITEATHIKMIVSYTHGNNKGNVWKMVRKYDGEKVNFIFQRLGKRGNPVNGDWWLSVEKINTMLAKGHIVIVEMQEVTEYEEKTVYKKTAKKQPKANFDVEALAGDVAEVTEDVKAEAAPKATKPTTSEEQATSKQLWALHVATKLDTRGLKITKAKASELIGKSKSGESIIDELKNLLGLKVEEVKTDITETELNSGEVEEVAEAIFEISADILTDNWTHNPVKPETEEEINNYKNKLFEGLKQQNVNVTSDVIEYIVTKVRDTLIVEALEEFRAATSTNTNYNSPQKTEPAQIETDPYAFNVDTTFKYHDIHFKAWNMEVSEIDEFLVAYNIPFYIACEKFICKGLTLDQVAIVEEINQLNAAIIFYDDKYNETAENVHNSTTAETLHILTPFEYGVKAFERGISCAPALDNEFLETHIKGLKVGEGGAGLMKEWITGWTKAQFDSTPFNFEETVNTHNSKATQEPQEPDNVVYYDFGNITAQEEEEEINTNIFDDILSKFDDIEVTADSKIAADDLEFCVKEEKEYRTAIETMINFATEIKKISGFDILSSEWHKQKSTNTYLDSYKFRELYKITSDIKDKFIYSIVDWFSKKYNVTIDINKMKFDFNLTYKNIIDAIMLQLDGFSFNEKAEKEIKDNLKSIFDNRYSKVNIKNSKIIINDYVWWDNYSWDGKRIGWNDSKVRPLFKALSLFEQNSNEMIGEFKSVYDELKEGERKHDIFSKYEFSLLAKVKSFKVFKNGKIEIEFISNQQAARFASEYCGYKQQTA